MTLFKAVLFDLDDTLLDREASVAYFIEQQYERLGFAFDGISKSDYIERFLELDQHGLVTKDNVYRQIVSDFELSRISWQDLFTDYQSQFDQYCINLPGLEPMLQTLAEQHRSLGIITNGPSPFQEQKIQTMGIADYFAVILVSAAEGVKKPEGEIFQRAVNRLGVEANEAIFIGDNPRADIEGAQAFGMPAIWRRVEYWGECPSADAVCDDLEQLPFIIQELEARLRG